MGVYLLAAGGVAVYKAREAVVLHNADPPVRAPELLDHPYRDFHGGVDDIVLADRVHADYGLERSAASMNRISFAGARGTIACSILPVLVSQSGQHRKAIRRGSRAGSRGATLLVYLLNYSCSRRLFPGNHSDYFIVNINMSFKQAGPQNCAA